MVIVKFIQNGLSVTLEGEQSTYRYSKNLEMQFVKDRDHQDYAVTPFFKDQNGNVGKLSITDDGIFKLDERFFLVEKPFYLSFALEKDDKIVHLGMFKMRVGDALGNETSVLPEDPTLWIQYVDKEIDKYFKANFQPKLDDFNSEKTNFDTKYREVSTKATEIESMKSSIDTTAQQVASNKSTVDQQAQNVVDNVEAFKADYAKKVEAFDKLNATSKKEIQDLTASSKTELDTKKNEISTNLDAQYAQFDEYMNRLNAMGIVVVDGCLCMYDE